MTYESEYFQTVAARRAVRPRVAALVIVTSHLLVQRPADDPNGCYAFPGGEYEFGDTFESRLRTEFAEETNCRLLQAEYLFVVENRFEYAGTPLHSLEHYFAVQLDRRDVESREGHLCFEWLPLSSLADYNLRPKVVRDTIVSGAYREIRHLVVRCLHGGDSSLYCKLDGD